MKVQMRGVSTKRHTESYKIGGQWRNRLAAYEMAKAGKIDGVVARKRGNVRFIQSQYGEPRLYDLPEVIR
jgi:hypothetical protein